MKKTLYWLLITNFILLPCSYLQAFSDVSLIHKDYIPINYFTSAGVIQGYQNNTFQPDKNVNRAEALKMILKAVNVNFTNQKFSRIFTDVNESDWFALPAIYGFNENIISGEGNPPIFSPGRNVNLAEFIKMLFCATKLDNEIQNSKTTETEFLAKNLDENQWFAPYINFALKIGILSTDEKQEIDAGKILTRADTTRIIFNLFEKSKKLANSILALQIDENLKNSLNYILDLDLVRAEACVYNMKILISKLDKTSIDEKLVLSIEKINESISNLLAAYKTAQENKFEETITLCQTAWAQSDEAIQIDNSKQELVTFLKSLIEDLAKFAREKIGK